MASKKLAPMFFHERHAARNEVDDVLRRNRMAIDHHPLAKVDEVRRGVRRHAQALGREQRCHRGHAAPLAVGSSDMERWILPFGVAERPEQGDGPLEAELEPAGGPRKEIVERVLIAASAIEFAGSAVAQGDDHPVAAGRPDICRSS